MKITRNKVAQFHYVITDDAGEELESTHAGTPNTYLHGYKNIMPALERVLVNKSAGDAFSVTLEPANAYGIRREDSEQRIPMKHLAGAKRWQPGMTATVNTKQGKQQVTVVKAGKFMVTIDTNHPWAGKKLTFDIEVTAVRDATQEELSHGHVHGDS
ncbi:MAG: peptidylprolyl isomerase [Gammaproteobacteria bacterium]|nr:peptidylprolyl isomerase [Gammaproteobacteria bacterium]